jgi:hypothetical protein
LGWEGTLLGFILLSDGKRRGKVLLDDPDYAGTGPNFYPEYLLTVIGDLADDDEHDRTGGGDAAGPDPRPAG